MMWTGRMMWTAYSLRHREDDVDWEDDLDCL